MRIVYGVTGYGLGHTMRARATAHHLERRGHTVKLVASGRAVAILRGHGLDVVEIEGMELRVGELGLARTRTVVDLLCRAPRALRRNASVGYHDVRAFDPHVLLTDFDSFTSALGLLLGRPVISIDHQHVLDRFRHPRAVEGAVSSYQSTRAVVTGKTPRCSHYVVTSFFFPEPRWGATSLVGPIVRPEIQRARPTRGDHVVVYQTTDGDPCLLPALGAVPETRFVVYGLGASTSKLGNVELRAYDEARFIHDLSSARAVIANGGFTTLSEAVYLGKPVLSVPIHGQAEQELNAAWLDHLGLGMRARRLDANVVRRFLERSDDIAGVADTRVRTGNADAMSAVERALAEVA